ncbi:MAG: 50S ribosomal protein L1 [Chitinivibrionales bacterium]|nr:50S ribosomal protein L1 [Chitinivibrionales bacterium]
MNRSKKWESARSKLDKAKEYSLAEAIEFLKANSHIKFNETVDVTVMLGVDPRKSDQVVRGSALLPNGLGKTVRVLAFVQGEKAQEAQDAGADYVGAEDMAEKITGGWLEFDAVVATPDMMKVVGKLGKILGTRGLMPNPKIGTVTMDIGKTVSELKKGKAKFRVDKGGILHAPVGKLAFDTPQLAENIKALYDAVLKAKPQAAKGQYIKKVVLSSTMGQGVRIDVNDLR